jgi:hypothetical protein
VWYCALWDASPQAGIGAAGKAVVDLFKWVKRALSVEDGALTQLFCATSPAAAVGGKFYVPIAQESELFAECPPITPELSARLWSVSEELAGEPFKP